jgi:hypothetical protein
MGHPHFKNVGLKLNAALDCDAAHSVVTGIRHWYQVIRQAVKFFHLFCCFFERLSVSPFGRANKSQDLTHRLSGRGVATVRAMSA